MNVKDRGAKCHKFQPQKEEACQSKLKRPTSAVANRPKDEYMKPTVNQEMKKQDPQGIKLQKTRQVMMEKDRQFKEECSFKPKINQEFQQTREETKEDRWKKLTQPKTAKQQQRDRLRMQEEQNQYQKDCTF